MVDLPLKSHHTWHFILPTLQKTMQICLTSMKKDIPAQLNELMMTYKYILKTSNCFSDGSSYISRKLDWSLTLCYDQRRAGSGNNLENSTRLEKNYCLAFLKTFAHQISKHM